MLADLVNRADISQSSLLSYPGIPNQHQIGGGISTHQGKALGIGRPLIGVDFQRIEVCQLPADSAVEGLQPQIVHAFFADRVHDSLAIGAEAELSLMPRVVLEGAQDLAGFERHPSDVWLLRFEIIGAKQNRLSVTSDVVTRAFCRLLGNSFRLASVD